ncbi:MAG: DUF4292 domain-containing protein [Bacteroidetes bacterium]|nr:DUF4292 domain-containing protein [Bacteroidota bacterium]
MNNIKIIAFFAAVLMFSCTTSKAITKGDKPVKKVNAAVADFIKNLDSAQPNYKWLRAKTVIDYEGENSISATAIIKMRKDSIVWSSVSILLEVARMLANTDSTVVLNNLQQTYSTYNLKDVEKFVAIPGLSLPAMQKLLLAFPPFPVLGEDIITSINNVFEVKGKRHADSMSFSMDAATMRMTHFRYRTDTMNVTVTYDKFEEKNGMWLPKSIKILAFSPARSAINISVSSYLISDEDEVRFHVPASFSNGRLKD